MFKGLFQKFRGPQATELPGYSVLGTIREGNTSVIFKAREQATGRIVAVKVGKPAARKAAEKPDSRHRDFTEGQIIASLDHPNIVTCLGHGDLAGAPYLVMEYLEGTTLANLAGGGGARLAGRRLSFVRQSAAAIGHVHSRRFIHHDFCLKNLFVVNESTVKLIDFAQATPLLALPSVASRMGTPEVIAPEILRREPSDHRVDIFAWAVVSYEVLCGHWPFESPEHHQTLNKVLNVHPVPLDRRVPGLPAEVSALIMRCIEKDPAKRPSGMASAVAVLERHVDARV
jgi:serine/threonine protein kinase